MHCKLNQLSPVITADGMNLLLLAVLGPSLAFCSLVGTLAFLYWLYPKPLVLLLTRYMGYVRAGLKRKFLHTKDFTFCYYERKPGTAKAGTTLVFVHGYNADKSMWISTAKFLPREWHVVALDLPGHGETSFKPKAGYSPMGLAEKVDMFINALGLEEFHLIGSSLGASIVCSYAAFYPKRLRSVTMIGMPGLHLFPGGVATWFMERLDRERQNFPYLLPTNQEELALTIKYSLFKAKSFMPHYQLRRTIVDLMLRRYTALKEIMEDLYLCDIVEDAKNVLSKISTATLILWGNQDEICHPSGAELLGSMIDGSKVVKLDQCGHMIAIDQPSELSAVLREFIAEKKTQ